MKSGASELTDPAGREVCVLFNNLIVFVKALPQALEKTQIDQQIDQRVAIGDRRAIAQMGALDTQREGLRVDAFDGGALAVDLFVQFTVAIKRVA